MKQIDSFTENFLVFVPTLGDLETVFKLTNACDMADDGMPDHTLDDLRNYWQSPDFNLATDAWLVVTPEGQPVGYADTDHNGHGRIMSYMRVHPEYRGCGIEHHLLQLVETRAQQRISEASANVRVALRSWISHTDKMTAQILEQEGFKFVRSFWRMEIELDQAVNLPAWPDGIAVRTLIAGKDEHTVFEMILEAFQDHWGHTPTTFEQWAHWMLRQDTLDPTLWFLAFDEDKLVGGALCLYEKDLDLGWVGQLGVLRSWRRKGLGMALLLHAFSEFYRRGITRVGLGVDSQNLTGATRLYERAGMHIALQHDTYEKELRAGQEPSTQSG